MRMTRFAYEFGFFSRVNLILVFFGLGRRRHGPTQVTINFSCTIVRMYETFFFVDC